MAREAERPVGHPPPGSHGARDDPDVDQADGSDAEDEELQSGLGRGLDSILAGSSTGPASVGAPSRRLDSLFGSSPPPAPPPLVGPPPTVPSPTPPVRRVTDDELIGRQLAGIAATLSLEVAAHVRPGPHGARLQLLRPDLRQVPAPVMNDLCSAIRAFVEAEPLGSDDFHVAGYHCAAFGHRPLDATGVYVLGRRHAPLTADERWVARRHVFEGPAAP